MRLSLILLLSALSAAAQTPASPDPRVKFKDGERYLRDLAAALELPRDSICRELSQYDCFSDAFRIVLGGVEPYRIRVVEPQEKASLTAPIALDRLAMHACTLRVEEDVKSPATAVLFRPSKARPDRKWKQQTATTIYDRILRRTPTAEETTRLVSFYDTVGRKSAATASRDWTVLACFAVASSLESVFY